MVTSGWLVAPGLTGDVWRYVSSTCGGQCVMTFGVLLMHVLLADSWDIQALVSPAVCSLLLLPLHIYHLTIIPNLTHCACHCHYTGAVVDHETCTWLFFSNELSSW